MLYLLVIILFFLLILAYYMSNKEIVAPSVLYSFSFFFCSVFALLNYKNWDLHISLNTFAIVGLSVFEFIIFTFVIHKAFSLIGNNHKQSVEKFNIDTTMNSYPIFNTYVLYVLVLIQIINIILLWRSLISATGQSLLGAMTAYNSDYLSGDNGISIPRFLTYTSTVNIGTAIYAEYFMSKILVSTKKIDLRLFFITLLGIVTSFSYGARGGSINLIITFGVFYFINYLKQNKKINFKMILSIMLAIIIVLILLNWSANYLNRNGVSENSFEYISTYVGAELSNLDSFVKMGFFPLHDGRWGQYTFGNLISNLTNIFNWSIPKLTNIYSYRIVNNYNLGNVYTTFVPWLCDFGYKGIFYLTLLMAFIAQSCYELAMRSTKHSMEWILFYGAISPGILLSFFSNKFYEQINTSLIYYLIIWYVLKHVFFIENNYKNKGRYKNE